MGTYKHEDLENVYRDLTHSCRVHATFTTEIVGGISPDEDAVRAFVINHLGRFPGLDPENEEDVEGAVKRILHEEIGETDTTGEADEIKESNIYGLKCFRRDAHGPWLGNWQIKACIKAAASRIGLTTKKRGSKGDLAEAGRVLALDGSQKNGTVEQVYLDGAETYYKTFKGRIQSPQGAKSIVTEAECAGPGARIHFEFRFGHVSKISEKDVVDMMAMAQQIGLGSNKAFERGRFRIDEMEVDWS